MYALWLNFFSEVNFSDLPGSPPAHRKSSQVQNVASLERQLTIEQRVKSGAETMIQVRRGETRITTLQP